MRGIVIGKTFTLALWGLYLAIGLAGDADAPCLWEPGELAFDRSV